MDLLLTLDENYLLPCRVMLDSFFTSNPGEENVSVYLLHSGIPAGKLEPGEDPVAGALRELKEETGAVPDTFLPMGVTLPSPGCLSERLYLFLAKGLHMESQQLDEDEFLNVERIPFNEMVHRVMDGEIEDSKTIAAVLKAKVLLNL